MLFSISWRGSPTVRNATAERFLKSGGMPPAGVKLIGRWHEVGTISGIDTAIEVDYYRHGGILPFVLRQLLAA